MLCNFALPGQLQWRSHEREGAADAFGGVTDAISAMDAAFTTADVVRWFPASENCSPLGYDFMQNVRRQSNAKFHVNDVANYRHVHDKIACFDTWKANGIPIPLYCEWKPSGIGAMWWESCEPPFLLRLNNSVAGQDSWLVRDWKQFPAALSAVEDCYRRTVAAKRGAITRLLCTKFIDTQAPGQPLNVSYRIIVAGNKVVTGYARVSDPQDWVAVTNKFHQGIADAWLFYNQRCQQIMMTHEALIVKAVNVLGLNHQGVDIIQDGQTGELYFLEVQSTYDAGFIGCGAYCPPYYNPYNPELLKFIDTNRTLISNTMPLYYYRWLDKREHFKTCYANLKETMQ